MLALASGVYVSFKVTRLWCRHESSEAFGANLLFLSVAIPSVWLSTTLGVHSEGLGGSDVE